jgi:hypothetical protein
MTRTRSRSRFSVPVVFAATLAIISSGLLFSDEAPLTRDVVEQKIAAGESLAEAQLSGLALGGLTADNINFAGATAQKADLRGAKFTGCCFDRAILKDAQARGVTIIRCSMVNAVLDGTDFSGARLEDVDMMGASLTGCKFAGARLTDLSFSPNRMYYTEGLRQALKVALGEDVSIAFTCGVSGDAFSFVYNSDDPQYKPGLPFSANPLVCAFDAEGAKATYRCGWIRKAAMNRLVATMLSGGICVLPLHLESLPDVGEMGTGPYAAVITKIRKENRDYVFEVLTPPFGSHEYKREELEQLWAYQTPTLEAAADGPVAPEATHALLMVPGPIARRPRADIAAAALRRAVELARDERTDAIRWPGIMGLNVLAADLHTAWTKEDAPSVVRMAAWQTGPRQDVIGSRKQAAAFLQEIAPLFDPAVQGDLITASGLYASEAQLLAMRWPMIQASAKTPAELDAARANCKKASGLILEVAALEKQATDTIERIVASLPPPAKPELPAKSPKHDKGKPAEKPKPATEPSATTESATPPK